MVPIRDTEILTRCVIKAWLRALLRHCVMAMRSLPVPAHQLQVIGRTRKQTPQNAPTQITDSMNQNQTHAQSVVASCADNAAWPNLAWACSNGSG
jgi:hypothetical protein